MDISIEEVIKNADNKEYALQVLKEQGKMLEFVSSELQDDEEVVKTALTQDGEALEFASDRLKGEKDIVLLAIKTAPWTAFYASESLKSRQRTNNEKCKRLWTNTILCK